MNPGLPSNDSDVPGSVGRICETRGVRNDHATMFKMIMLGHTGGMEKKMESTVVYWWK